MYRYIRKSMKPFIAFSFVSILGAVSVVFMAYIINLLVEANVRGILNFTPLRLTAPDHIRVQNVDLTNELQTLIYFLDNNNNN